MLSPDEEIKPTLPLLSACGSSNGHSTERPLWWAAIQMIDDGSATPLARAPSHMTHKISQAAAGPEVGPSRLCTRVHGAGFKPNIMSRFMHSNSHEVLFVN